MRYEYSTKMWHFYVQMSKTSQFVLNEEITEETLNWCLCGHDRAMNIRIRRTTQALLGREQKHPNVSLGLISTDQSEKCEYSAMFEITQPNNEHINSYSYSPIILPQKAFAKFSSTGNFQSLYFSCWLKTYINLWSMQYSSSPGLLMMLANLPSKTVKLCVC